VYDFGVCVFFGDGFDYEVEWCVVEYFVVDELLVLGVWCVGVFVMEY